MTHHSDDGTFADDAQPSKTRRKKEMQALQDLGGQLVELSVERLRKVPLPEALFEAVCEARRITTHGARRRQMQYIGKLMRNVDPVPIQAQLDIFNGLSRVETARQHRLEQLRADILADERVLGRVAGQWPDADLQHLRNLRRNALKEREQDKPPRASRELFRVLRELEEGGNAQADAALNDDLDDLAKDERE